MYNTTLTDARLQYAINKNNYKNHTWGFLDNCRLILQKPELLWPAKHVCLELLSLSERLLEGQTGLRQIML